MAFDKINAVKDYEYYIDMAFGSANKKAKSLQIKGKPIERKVALELAKVAQVRDVLDSQLSSIIKTFPSLDQVTQFYRDLISITIGLNELKKSLGAVNWARKKISFFFKKYSSDIRNTKNVQSAGNYRKQYYGRANSVLKQIKNDFLFLEQSRKILRNFPTIKSMFTVAIAGFPNVGKSTLLTKLTGANPEIASYAFTTKSIMMGTIKEDSKKIQLIDGPGTLNRFNKMNEIEQQAWLALKDVANVIIYVFDLTEPYPLSDQEKLYRNISEMKKPVLIYLSKTDIIDRSLVNNFLKTHEAFTDYKILKKEILKKAI